MIPVRPERSNPPVRPERSEAKSKDALFVLATVLMIVALAGCGGGGGGKTAALPTPVAIEELPRGSMLEPGTILPGMSRTLQNADGTRTVVTCPDGGDACVVTLGPDGAPQSTGGTPTVETVSYTTIELPEGHELMAGTIRAGEIPRTVHQTFETRTVVTCPADGDDCDVTAVTENGAESTGGTLTVTTYTTLYLPSGHTLAEGTTIPAGESRAIGYSRGRSYDLACPLDGEDCEIILGEYDFESTGGMPYLDVAASNEMVWQANNGPDGTSNGAHARGLEGRLLLGSSLNPLYGAGDAGDARRHGAIVTNTKSLASDTRRTVNASASWASSDAAPTLGLTVSDTGTNTFSVDGDSDVPSLGTGWNGAALSKTVPTGSGSTAHAVLYSNIEKQPDGGNADAYYLVFGAWLSLPDDPASGIPSDLGVFANGYSSNPVTIGQVMNQAGTATYRGPATGLYSTATYTGSGAGRALQSAKVGSFTARATIWVNFGAGIGSFNSTGGNVADFMENGESLGNWTVSFNSTSSRDSSAPAIFVGDVRGQADGPIFSAGRWGVQFYRESTSGHPDSAVGTFTASTAASDNEALRLAGVFGADRQ